MALPTAIISALPGTIPASSLPTTQALDGSTSTPGTGGASIVGYQWYLVDKPPTSTASLSGATTATPTLIDIDVPGSYRCFLVVEDDIGSFSFQSPTPLQANSSGVILGQTVTTAYAFYAAPATAFATVQVTLDATGLIKTAQGDRGWFVDSYWPLIDEVESLRLDVGAYAPTQYDVPLAAAISNVAVATAWANEVGPITVGSRERYNVSAEFDVTVNAGDLAELALYIAPTATLTAGTKVFGVTVDASCSVVIEGSVRIANPGVTVAYTCRGYKEGPTVPAAMVPGTNVALAFASATMYVGYVLTPAGAGTWGASSSADMTRGELFQIISRY